MTNIGRLYTARWPKNVVKRGRKGRPIGQTWEWTGKTAEGMRSLWRSGRKRSLTI
ncbi:hypothetical protein HMPREF0262_02745 [Clostridium sp. ATCC 29733]|nr:hypothetical protein HMPREF0262_02745 [Clostridium sp. ATCC 29733]